MQKKIRFLILTLIVSYEVKAAADLSKYNRHLNGIKSLKASLEQICPNGKKMHGKLYIQKPGKLRLNYEPANTLQLFSDGKRLIQYDGVHKESNSMQLQNSPLYFLLTSGQLENLALVQQVIPGPKWTQVIVKSRQDPDAGVIKLVFQESPLHLIRWVLTDAQGNKTVVTLSNIELNKPIPAQALQLK